MHEIKKKQLFVLFVFAVLLRSFFGFISYSSGQYMFPDSYDYVRLTNTLSQMFVFGDEAGYEIFRVPGYSFFIFLLRIIGVKSFFAVILLQNIISAFTCLLVYKLARIFFSFLPEIESQLVSILAMCFQILTVSSVIYSSVILSETLFTFFFILFIIFIMRAGNGKIAFCYLSGILCGVLSLIRSVALPLFIFGLILVWLKNDKKLKGALFFSLPAVLIIGFWTTRNYITADYLGFSSAAIINFYRYDSCAIESWNKNLPFSTLQREFDGRLAGFSNQTKKADFAYRYVNSKIRKNFSPYVIEHLEGMLASLLPATGDFLTLLGSKLGGGGTLGVINSEGLVAGVYHFFKNNYINVLVFIPFMLLLGFKYLMFLFGCILSFKKGGVLFTLFLLLIIIYFLLAPGAAGHPRFRVPVEPVLSLFAGYGLYFLLTTLTSSIKRKSEL